MLGAAAPAAGQPRLLELVPMGGARVLPERVLGASAEPFWDDFIRNRRRWRRSSRCTRLTHGLPAGRRASTTTGSGGCSHSSPAQPLELLQAVCHARELRGADVSQGHLAGAIQAVQRRDRRLAHHGPQPRDGDGGRPGQVVPALGGPIGRSDAHRVGERVLGCHGSRSGRTPPMARRADGGANGAALSRGDPGVLAEGDKGRMAGDRARFPGRARPAQRDAGPGCRRWNDDLRPEPWFDAVTLHLNPRLNEVVGRGAARNRSRPRSLSQLAGAAGASR